AAMRLGQTKYTEVGGIAELRAAVVAKLKRDNGLHYEPADVVISCGAKHTLFNIMVALLNPGDQVLVPSPYWVSYPEQARLLPGRAGSRRAPGRRSPALGHLRRVLRGADLRGAPHLDRPARTRHQSAHDRGQYLLEGLRDDGLADRIRRRLARAHPRHDERPEPGDVQPVLDRAMAGGGGP